MWRSRSAGAVAAALLAGAVLAPMPAPAAARAVPPRPNPQGINVPAPLDAEGGEMYADAIREAREPACPTDADGWPAAADCTVVVWSGGRDMHGRYALSFQGRAAAVRAEGGRLSPVRYDAARNRSSATLLVEEAGPTTLRLSFAGARRSRGGPPGLTALRLMRPVAPGAARSHAPGTLFHPPLLALVQRFQVVRFMDYLATNCSALARWEDRPRPSWMTFQRNVDRRGYGWQGSGGPLEHAVAFANAAHRDAWINVPAMADDRYVRNLALLLRYGSDGVDPYTAPQPHPVFPPLAPDLKLYVEYSNELWNGTFPQAGWNRAQADAEVARGGSDLAYDGQARFAAARRIARRGLEVSRIFREVFGDAQMMSRVRPILATQSYGSGEWLAPALAYLHEWWNDPARVRHPHPPSWWFYGGGGTAYWGPGEVRPLTLAPGPRSIWTAYDMDAEGWRARALLEDAHRLAAFGLRRVAYEGGPSLDGRDQAELKAQAVMTGRPAVPNMTDAMLEHQRVWRELGGELVVYYTAVHDYEWSFAGLRPGTLRGDLRRLDSPKLAAVAELAARPAGPIRLGAPVPGALPGEAVSASSRAGEPPRPGAQGARVLHAGEWAGYVFRADAPGRRRVRLRIDGGQGAVDVYWDGARAGSGREVELPPATAGLHGVIVRAASGTVRLEAVEVE